MFVVIIHSFSHNSLGLEGAEFLSSVLPSLPNLTSLRWDYFCPMFNIFANRCFLSMTSVSLDLFAVFPPKSPMWIRSSLRPCCRLPACSIQSEQHTHFMTCLKEYQFVFPLSLLPLFIPYQNTLNEQCINRFMEFTAQIQPGSFVWFKS